MTVKVGASIPLPLPAVFTFTEISSILILLELLVFLKVSCNVDAPFVVIVEPDIVTPVVELLIEIVPEPDVA